VLAASGGALAHRKPFVRFEDRALAPGVYVYAVELRAAMNPARRQAFVSRAFRVTDRV